MRREPAACNDLKLSTINIRRYQVNEDVIITRSTLGSIQRVYREHRPRGNVSVTFVSPGCPSVIVCDGYGRRLMRKCPRPGARNVPGEETRGLEWMRGKNEALWLLNVAILFDIAFGANPD